MKGHAEVVAYLKTLLKGELAARDQYFVHSRYYQDWGLSKLFERLNHEMEEETQHADALLQRILFLEGVPDMTPNAFTFGKDVEEMFRLDLAVEYEVRAALAKGIALCEQHGDYISREILEVQLHDTEEDHAYWLEQQLGLIRRSGLELYQASKIDAKGSPAH